MTLPDCMMGPSDPCDGFAETYHEVERLRAALEATDRRLAELDYHTTSPLRIAIRKALANEQDK